MADDIDIEEHDVLDNPVIRSIFPDISVIKKEISQYYEDEPIIKEEPEVNKQYVDSSKDQSKSTSDSSNVGVCATNINKECLKNPYTSTKQTNNSKADKTKVGKPLQANKIILGSKPSITPQSKNEEIGIRKAQTKEGVRLPKVILQDVGPYIYRTNRYCKDCLTLFPSRSDCDDHKRKLHLCSIKTRNKQLNVVVTLDKPSLQQNRHRCNMCDSHFSCRANLSRHYKNIHKKKVSFKSKSNITRSNQTHVRSITKRENLRRNLVPKHIKSNVITAKNHEKNQKAEKCLLKNNILKRTRSQCSICGSYFSCSSNLSRHYRNIHQKKVTFKSQNNRNSMIPNRSSNLAKKITRSQRNLPSKPNKNECFHCKKDFPDHKSLVEHIYEVLEPKRYSKRYEKENASLINQPKKLCNTDINKKPKKKVSGDMSKCNDLEIPKGKQNVKDMHDKNKNTTSTSQKRKLSHEVAKKQKHFGSPSLKSKLMFESEESDISDNQYSESYENNEYEDPEMNIKTMRNKTVPNSKNELQRKKTSTQSYTDENLRSDTCDLNTLSHKRKYDDRDVADSISQPKAIKRKFIAENLCESKSSKKIRNLDIGPSDPKSTKKKQLKPKNESDKVSNVKSNKTNANDNQFVYECIYCSYMLPTAKAYFMHVNGKHKVEKVRRVNKVTFDEQCKYCPSSCTNVGAHNKHVYTYHSDLLFNNYPELVKHKEQKITKLKNPAFKMFESFVLNSIIYNCNKCDIHFLSSCVAKDHVKHMELLVHWKCSLCKKIFKKHDKYLHLKQHNFSKTLNVCQLNESELSTLLYKCTKCTIHFEEERYLEHYSKCDEETTDSMYCKSCDFIIDQHGFKSHENFHSQGKTVTDFTVIVSDIIEVTKKSNNEAIDVNIEKKRKRVYEQVNCLTFCPTCNCYLSDLALSRKAHIEARCSEIPKYTCKLCGLVLTNKALGTHREHHKTQSELKVQDFKFFDLKGIQINPPIPDYPQCKNCEVHFVSRNAVISHICSEIEHMTCDLCNIKLTENAFKLHMNFHNYSMLNTNKKSSQIVIGPKPQEQEIEVKLKESESKVAHQKTNTEYEQKSTHDHRSNNDCNLNLAYLCQSCKIAVDTYDKAVDHCQNHYSPGPVAYSMLKTCPKCLLKFEIDAYENHQRLHSRAVITTLMFDPMYFTSNNNTWIQHVFASAPQIMKEVVDESIYRYECRIKMKVVQKGPSNLTVYKCDKCGNFIDPDCLFAHVESVCPKNIRKHPCSVCGLPFMSNSFRNNHEEIHRRYSNVRIKSYNIVLINCETHNTYTASILNAMKQYVLYQCRTCDGVVDKWQRNAHQCRLEDLLKCSKCRLLVYKEDFEKHVCKHNDLVEFKTANIKVILFGNKNGSNLNKILSSNFDGRVSDYTLYKCVQCEVCVHNEISISRHLCEIGDSKWKCPKCDFYICANLSLNQHLKMHDIDTEFRAENIKIINFNDNENKLKETKEKIHTVPDENNKTQELLKPNSETNDVLTVTEPNVDHDVSKPSDDNDVIVEEQESVPIYKCACGLHYMNESNAREHANNCTPKNKVIKQSCSKCSWLFSPKELFSHLIANHSDKNKIYKYEVIEILPEQGSTTT